MKMKLCGHPGCNKLVISGGYFCPAHQLLHDRQRKENAFKSATRYANYNSPEWRRIRQEVLAERKYCEKCGSTYRRQVDHIIPVRERPDLFLCKDNLQVLCQNCHNTKTAAEINSRRRDR